MKTYLIPVSIVIGCLILGGSFVLINSNKSYSIEQQQRLDNERGLLKLKMDECESLSVGVRQKWNNVMGVTYSELWEECVVTYTDTETGEVGTSPLSRMQTTEN